MLNHITWTQYFIAVGIVSAAYYLLFLARYYSSGLSPSALGRKHSNSFATGRQAQIVTDEISSDSEEAPAFFNNSGNDEFADVEELIGRLKKVIKEASLNDAYKDDLSQYIGLVLQEYPGIRNSPLRSSVNELVESECQKYGAVTLGQDEVDLLWDTE